MVASCLLLSDRDFASCRQCLMESSVAAVLTVDSNELSYLLCDKHADCDKYADCDKHADCDINWKHPTTKFVYALDETSFNILACLVECVEFIEIFIKNNVNVLVHW